MKTIKFSEPQIIKVLKEVEQGRSFGAGSGQRIRRG